MPTIGTIVRRYPGGDPENGPSYLQRWTGSGWECAGHDYQSHVEPDPEDMKAYLVTQCRYCGDYQGEPQEVQP